MPYPLESPTPSLIDTNDIPSPQDEERIRQMLHEAQEEVAGLQEPISRQTFYDTKVDLDWTALRIMYLKKFVRQHEPLLSSIRRLPPELLEDIFLRAIPTRAFRTDSSVSPPEVFDYKTTYALTQTCAYWRRVAVSTPQLWTSIPPVSFLYLKGGEDAGLVSLVRMFLERSQNALIHVVISKPFFSIPPSKNGVPNFSLLKPYDLLLANTRRWKTAVVHLSHEILETFRELDLPILHALNIHVRQDIALSGAYDCPTHVFKNTPALKHIIIDNRQMYPSLDVLFSTLESYTGLPRSIEDLRSTHLHLERCVLRGPLVGMYPPSGTRIVFSKLKYLRVANTNYDTRFHFETWTENPFNWIETPVLETLEVEGHPTRPAPSEIVKYLLSKTLPPARFCLLRSLTYHMHGVTEQDFHQLLAVAPLLVTLDIWDMPSHFFKRLIMKTAQTSHGFMDPLVPRLQSLTIRGFTDTDDFTIFAEIYDSRRLSDESHNEIEHNLTISLAYRSARVCNKVQNLIEGWQEVEPGRHAKGSECAKVLGWSTYLIKQFVALALSEKRAEKFGITGKPTKRVKYFCSDMNKLHAFFSVVENFEFKDMTRILRVLADIRDLPPNAIHLDAKYLFRWRAGRLVEKWSPLVEESAKKRRWILTDDCLTLRLGGSSG